jgi:hypothetical protein
VAARRDIMNVDFARAFVLLRQLVERAEAAEHCPFCGLNFGVKRPEGSVLPAHNAGCPAGEAAAFLAELEAHDEPEES